MAKNLLESGAIRTKEQFLEVKKFLDSLKDHDDVQKVYSNLEIPEQ